MKTEVYSVDMGGGKSSCVITKDLSPALTCTHYGEPAVVYQRNSRDETHKFGIPSKRLKGEDSKG